MEPSNIENYFPQGIASGSAFLGREQEVKWLSENIACGHHTLLIAPRRYGKTSLATNTLSKLKIPYEELDLHLAISIHSVEKKIINALAALMKMVTGKNEHLLKLVQDFFKNKKIKWTLGFKGVLGVELEPDDAHDRPENILIALNLLDHILLKKNKKAVLFIDEFQEIHNLDEGRQIQGAIRHFAQASKKLVFIFSGSNRNTLIHMFDDKSQPMYELCDRIILKRIAAKNYKNYINKISLKTWGEKITDVTFNEIVDLTNLHPRRVYNLCYYLWRLHANKKTIPAKKDVRQAWDYFIKQRVKDLRHSLSRLSPGQLKILTLISTKTLDELTGKKAQQLTKMAGASIIKALHKLEDEDFVEKNEQGKYYIIDPMIAYFLLHYEKENIEYQ